MIIAGQEKPVSAPLREALRLVVCGYGDVGALAKARDALRTVGLDADQICIFGLARTLGAAARRRGLAPDPRRVDDLDLEVVCSQLFDGVGMGGTEPHGGEASWMPRAQAEALWSHVRSGRPVLVACAAGSDQQVACSTIQLQHRPRFVHTFNFNR
jgi:hypothetical protein